MAVHWWSEVRGRVPRGAAVALGVAPILLLLAGWWWFTHGEPEERVIGPAILPSPREVLRQTVQFVRERDMETAQTDPLTGMPIAATASNRLLHHTWLSLRRVLLGYLCAAAVVLPLGVLMGAFGAARTAFGPVMGISGYIPIATLAPLTMSWFGTGELQKVFFLALAFAVYLLPQVLQAVNAVPDVYLRTAYTLGATRWQAISRVLVPVALPDIWYAMRLAFGVGWTYLILTESLIMAGGLGEIVMVAQRRGPRENIYLAILVIALIAWCSDVLWVRLGQRLFPYRQRAS